MDAGTESVRRPKIRLVVDVPAAQVPGSRLTEGQVNFELPDTETQRVCRQLEEPANIDELQISIPKSAGRVQSTYVEVAVHPESDAIAKIAGREDAEQPRLEVGARNERPSRSGVEVVRVLRIHLKESVESQANLRQPRNRARPDRMRKHLLLRRSSQHHRRNLDEILVVLRELESRVLESL